jgi:N-acetyl-anhydromuramyl-L-alanine amidase AmpD
MDGLGYHFVIGNGTLSGDGEIEVGYRWKSQIHGAHARAKPGDDNRWNELGIGICLIGDFRYVEPSEQQLDTLVRLVRSLRVAYAIPAASVVPHEFVKPTICPGPKFPWAEFHARIR